MAFTRFVLPLVLLASLAPAAGAIPLFARRYGTGCDGCHQPFPRLTSRGAMFAAHGFRREGETVLRDTIATRDSLLTLGRDLPLALRLEMRAHAAKARGSGATTDLGAPWTMKVLSSAPLSRDLSYYFYFVLTEHGELEGVEDAIVHWNDIGGRPVDLVVGQFQVSDPLFKRELRLSSQDYAIYVARIGDVRANLAYERGAMLSAELGRGELLIGLANGNGRAEGDERRSRLDDDPNKNVFARASFAAWPERVRFGAFAYAGRQNAEVDSLGTVRATQRIAGLDATVTVRDLTVNAQWLHREDVRPTFTPGEPDAVTDGGFLEAVWARRGSRWYGYGLWNRIDTDRPLLDAGSVRSDARREQTFAAGVGRRLRTNVRLQGEAAWDSELEEARATLSLHAAY